MEWYGKIKGILHAKRGVIPDLPRYDHYHLIQILDRENQQEIKNCLEDVLMIEGITGSGQSERIEKCDGVYEGHSVYDSRRFFSDHGTIGSVIGEFDMHVSGSSKEAVEFALEYIGRYLYLEKIKTKVKERSRGRVERESD